MLIINWNLIYYSSQCAKQLFCLFLTSVTVFEKYCMLLASTCYVQFECPSKSCNTNNFMSVLTLE